MKEQTKIIVLLAILVALAFWPITADLFNINYFTFKGFSLEQIINPIVLLAILFIIVLLWSAIKAKKKSGKPNAKQEAKKETKK